MTKTKFILIAILNFLALVSIAQKNDISISLLGGGSKLFTTYKPSDAKFKNPYVLSGIIYANYYRRLNTISSIGIGVSFSDIRGREKSERTFLTNNGNTKTSVNLITKSYLYAGINPKYRHTINKFTFDIGGYWSFLVRNRCFATGNSSDGINVVNWEYEVEQTNLTWDAGLTLNASYLFSERFTIGISYNQGFANIASVKAEYVNYTYPWKNFISQIGISLEYKLTNF